METIIIIHPFSRIFELLMYLCICNSSRLWLYVSMRFVNNGRGIDRFCHFSFYRSPEHQQQVVLYLYNLYLDDVGDANLLL